MKKTLPSVLTIGSLGFAGPAMALSLNLVPALSTVDVGQSLAVDIVASLASNEIVSAYDLNIGFDASVLTANSVTFGMMLGGDPMFQSFGLSPGVVDLAEVSLLFDSDLASIQQPPASFTLATLLFTAGGSGTSPLNFINYGNPGLDIKGSNNVPYDQPTLGASSVTIGTVSSVPEHGTFLLLMTGLSGLALAKRRVG